MEVRIYHNPRCSKSRQALSLLESRGIKPHVILYLDKGLGHLEIKQLLQQLGMNVREVMRIKEAVFKENNLDNPSLSEGDLIDALVQWPKLLERPVVVVNDTKAVMCRPPENVFKVL